MNNVNVLADYYRQSRPYKIEKVKELLHKYFEGNSFLIAETESGKEDIQERLSLKQYDDNYGKFISAEDIYNEFKKFDEKLYKNNVYSTDIMLEIMKEYTEDRYKSFKNVYDRKYKERPEQTVEEYLEHFEETLYKLMRKLNMSYYEKGFTKKEQEDTKEHLGETYLYLLSIGKWRLADEILEHYNKEPLQKPKILRTHIANIKRKNIRTMVLKCKITKKAATKYIEESTKKIKDEYLNSWD